ncbi:MAG TPA: hypothetical protein VGL86_14000 [Polyangia bacterium]|jgi:polyhydroxybutyrate depolymerase
MIRALAVVAIVAALATTATAHGEPERGYTIYTPKSMAKPAPAIVALHCFTCSPGAIVEMFQLRQVADAHGAMLVMPLGRVNSDGIPYWDATDACCNFEHAPGDDVAFIDHVLDAAIARGADPKRIYLVGMSNGGFFAHRLACDRAPRIAAIVDDAGSGWDDASRCKATQPVSVLEIRGDADEAVPYDGGMTRSHLPKSGKMVAARTDVARWAERDHCTPAPETAGNIDFDSAIAGAETAVERWSCPHNAVELWTVHGGRHMPDTNADVGERIWKWLAAQHK